MSEEALLGVGDLDVRFRGVVAVSGVGFQIATGQVAGLIGPNGAGKSSVLNAISGLVPYRGRVVLGGTEISDVPPWRRIGLGISRTFQNIELIPSLTAADNIMLGRHHLMGYDVMRAGVRIGRAGEDELRHRLKVEAIVRFFELERWRDRKASDLPPGVLRIVSLARAMAAEPSVLLLDEVGSGLTREEKEDLARFILRLKAQYAIAILWVEHDVRLIGDLADFVTVMDHGKQIATGRPGDVLARPDVQSVFTGTLTDEQVGS